ncbi:MAG: hypothetical protein CSYNP_01428 [Syntrophus sp. SKADARSKE-3]|nr:hypothetical protein [Syntrophus sp. SKADARSKE-3]
MYLFIRECYGINCHMNCFNPDGRAFLDQHEVAFIDINTLRIIYQTIKGKTTNHCRSKKFVYPEIKKKGPRSFMQGPFDHH